MKKIYIVILFMVFFNVFNLMFATMNMFEDTSASPTQNYSSLANSSSLPEADTAVEDITGYDFNNIWKIFFAPFEGVGGVLAGLALTAGVLVICWITRTIAPVVLLVLANVFLNTYKNSIGVFKSIPVNDYIFIALGIMMLFLFVITAAEYLTHGDA